MGPLGIVRSIKTTIRYMSKLQTGMIYHYILMMVIAIVLIYLRFNVPLFDTITLSFIFIILCIYYFKVTRKIYLLER